MLLGTYKLLSPSAKAAGALAFLLMAVSALGNAALPLSFKWVIDALEAPAPSRLTVALLTPVLLYAALQLVARVAGELRWRFFGRCETEARHRLQADALVRLLSIHGSGRDANHGEVAALVAGAMNALRVILLNLLFILAPLVLEFLFVLVTVVTFFGLDYVAILAATSALYVAATWKGSAFLEKRQKASVLAENRAAGRLSDYLLNAEPIRSFGNEAYAVARLADAQAAASFATRSAWSGRGLAGLAQSLVIALGVSILLALSGWQAAQGQITVGAFVMVNTYLLQLMRPLESVGRAYREVQSARQSLRLLEERVAGLPAPAGPSDPPGAIEAAVPLALRDVTFGYEHGRPVLRNLSLDIPAGSFVALVGESGSGKSTVARLLLGLHTPQAGEVRVAGRPAADWPRPELVARLAVVPQDTVLLDDTLFENIRFGRPDATRAEVLAAARAAQLDDVIGSAPEGVDLPVGDRGSRLSGGQRQRVAIARALLRRAPVTILDEATAALDLESERRIVETFVSGRGGRTVVAIAHRLAAIRGADRILVMRDGAVAESGTHDELLARDGPYAALWRIQRNEPSVARAPEPAL